MRLLFPMALSLLVACTPYSYHDEVSLLGRGVEELRVAFREARHSTTSAAEDAERARWRLERRALGPSSGCIRDLPAGSPPCALVAAGGVPSGPSEAQAVAKATAPLMAGLADYARSLVEVVDAVDQTALSRAVEALRTNAMALGERSGASVGKVGSALAKLTMRPLGALIRIELEKHKLEVMRAAMTEADPAIVTLAEPIGRALELAGAERLRFLRDEAMTLTEEQRRALRRGLSDQEYAERTMLLDQKARRLARGIEADPTGALRALVEAHSALGQALREPGQDRRLVRQAVETFAGAATKLRQALADTSVTDGSEG